MVDHDRVPPGLSYNDCPSAWRAVQNTDGFEYLPQSAQTATIEFAFTCLGFFKDPSDANHQRYLEALAQVEKSNGIKTLALELVLRLVAETLADERKKGLELEKKAVAGSAILPDDSSSDEYPDWSAEREDV